METYEQDVNSTTNNAPSESSSYSVSTRNSCNSRVIPTYNEEEEDELNYPDCEEKYIPEKESTFDSIEKCIKVYETYAYHSGFDVRKGTQRRLRDGTVSERYLMCNKAKYGQDSTDTTNFEKKKRNSSTQISNCKASVIFKLNKKTGMYTLDHFEQRHNHKLVPKEHKHLLKKSRQLGLAEMNFIHKVSTANIGATTAHHIYSNFQGSYKNTHGTVIEFKNHQAAINCYIGSNDSQMLINKMENKLNCVRGFSFNYKVIESKLAGLFWADETAKLNFKEFGDIISFDATYRTNKYNLIFVSFTAIDNHKKTVSIGAGMLHNETSESYQWLLGKFLFKKTINLVN